MQPAIPWTCRPQHHYTWLRVHFDVLTAGAKVFWRRCPFIDIALGFLSFFYVSEKYCIPQQH